MASYRGSWSRADKARGLQWAVVLLGGMTINEVRRLENLPPVTGGDEVRMQMQNVPIAEARNADQAQ